MDLCQFFAAADLPVGKAVLMLLLAVALAVSSTAASFVPQTTLRRYADVIGTDKPRIARGACVAGAVVGWIFVVSIICSLAGIFD